MLFQYTKRPMIFFFQILRLIFWRNLRRPLKEKSRRPIIDRGSLSQKRFIRHKKMSGKPSLLLTSQHDKKHRQTHIYAAHNHSRHDAYRFDNLKDAFASVQKCQRQHENHNRCKDHRHHLPQHICPCAKNNIRKRQQRRYCQIQRGNTYHNQCSSL